MTASNISTDSLLHAYRSGVFPMAENRDDPTIVFVDPEERAILPLDRFHLSHSLRKTIRSGRFEIRVDTAFREVMECCRTPAADRPTSWISDRVLELYCHLHEQGRAHSVETWRAGRLVGGLCGVRIGAAFFGESMFSREPDASKTALAWLVARLRRGGFSLLDCQFQTSHLASLGAIEIPRAVYHALLRRALGQEADFFRMPADSVPKDALLALGVEAGSMIV